MGRGPRGNQSVTAKSLLFGPRNIQKESLLTPQEALEKFSASLSPTFVDEDGTKYWKNQDGKLHREGAPAIEYPPSEGRPRGARRIQREEWRGDPRSHECHSVEGSRWWYINGELHREDGPAIEYPDGTEEWYQDGKQHRLDGPAVVKLDGSNEWYQNGLLHRLDGPALEKEDNPRWSWKEQWLRDGKYHRDDGPAIETSYGDNKWFQDGKLHREDGPAVIKAEGSHKEWYINGELHREDGPAIIKSNGDKEWYKNGELLRSEAVNAKE